MATRKHKQKFSNTTMLFIVIAIFLAIIIISGGMPETAQYFKPGKIAPIKVTTPTAPKAAPPTPADYQTQIDAEFNEIQSAIVAKGANWTASKEFVLRLTTEQRKLLVSQVKPVVPSEGGLFEKIGTLTLPSSIDWHNYNGKNWMTSVKNQDGCGSCGVFSMVGALEARVNIAQNEPNPNLDLSEQYIVSCLPIGNCKKGGWSRNSMADYIASNGLPDESCFPYKADDNLSCNNKCLDWEKRAIYISGWNWTDYTVDGLKKSLVTWGPLEIYFDVYNDFFYYSSGIYSYTTGDFVGLHGMVLVGYDDTNKYWIVKNSWGTDWGESGYAKIAYGQAIETIGTSLYPRSNIGGGGGGGGGCLKPPCQVMQ